MIVASQVSSTDNAYFYITTTIGGTVNLLAINMGASLTVEGSHDPARLAANTRAALKRMARIMLPVCGLLFLGAPYILHVFGAGYAHAATPLLRWFAVGALLRVVMETYFAVLRAQSRTSGLAYLQGLLCLLVLGLTVILLPRMGLTGAGVAEISSLAVIVTIAAPRLFRIVRTAPPAAPPADAAPDGDLADLGPRDAVPSHEPKRGPARRSTRTPWPCACTSTSTTWNAVRTCAPGRARRRPAPPRCAPGRALSAAPPGRDGSRPWGCPWRRASRVRKPRWARWRCRRSTPRSTRRDPTAGVRRADRFGGGRAGGGTGRGGRDGGGPGTTGRASPVLA